MEGSRLCEGGSKEKGEADRVEQSDSAKKEPALWEEVALARSERVVDIARGLVSVELSSAGDLSEA